MPLSRLWRVLTVILLAAGLCLASGKGSTDTSSPVLLRGRIRHKVEASQSSGLQPCLKKLKSKGFNALDAMAKTIFHTSTKQLKSFLFVEEISYAELALFTQICWKELEKDPDRAYEFKSHPIMSKPQVIKKVSEKLGDEEGPAYLKWIDRYYSNHHFDSANDPYYNIRVTNFQSDGTLGPLKELIAGIHETIIHGDMHPHIPVALPPPNPEDRKLHYITLKSLLPLCTGTPPNKDVGLFDREVIYAYLNLVAVRTSSARDPTHQVIWLRPSFMKEEFSINGLHKGATVILGMPNSTSDTWELVLMKNLKGREPLLHHIALSGASKGFESTLKRIREKVAPLLGKKKFTTKSELSPFAVEKASQTAGALLYHAKMVFFGYNPMNEASRLFVHDMPDLSRIVAAELLMGLVFLPESLSRHYVLNKGYMISGQVEETEDKEISAKEEKKKEKKKSHKGDRKVPATATTERKRERDSEGGRKVEKGSSDKPSPQREITSRGSSSAEKSPPVSRLSRKNKSGTSFERGRVVLNRKHKKPRALHK